MSAYDEAKRELARRRENERLALEHIARLRIEAYVRWCRGEEPGEDDAELIDGYRRSRAMTIRPGRRRGIVRIDGIRRPDLEWVSDAGWADCLAKVDDLFEREGRAFDAACEKIDEAAAEFDAEIQKAERAEEDLAAACRARIQTDAEATRTLVLDLQQQQRAEDFALRPLRSQESRVSARSRLHGCLRAACVFVVCSAFVVQSAMNVSRPGGSGAREATGEALVAAAAPTKGSDPVSAPPVRIAPLERLVANVEVTLCATPEFLREELARTTKVGDPLFEPRTARPSVPGILYRIAEGPPKLREALFGLFALGLMDPNPHVQMAALWGVWRAAPNDPDIDLAARHFAQVGGGRNSEVRAMAMRIIKERDTPENLAFLAAVLANPDVRSDTEIIWSLFALTERRWEAAREPAAGLLRHRHTPINAHAAILLDVLGDPRGRARLLEIARGDIAATPQTSGARVIAMRRLLEARDPVAAEIALAWLHDPSNSLIEYSVASKTRVALGASFTRSDAALMLQATSWPIDRHTALSNLAEAGDLVAPAELFGLFEYAVCFGDWSNLISDLHRATGGEYRAQIAKKIMEHDWTNHPHELPQVQRAYEEAFGEITWPTHP